MTDQPKPTPCCSVLFPQRDAVSPKDVHGCVLANGHHGPHQFFATNLRQYSWSTDMECDCDDCQSDEPANWCTVYREVTAAPELQQRVDQLEKMLTIDGIEDLIKDLADHKQLIVRKNRQLDTMTADNQRLRELLQSVADWHNMDHENTPPAEIQAAYDAMINSIKAAIGRVDKVKLNRGMSHTQEKP